MAKALPTRIFINTPYDKFVGINTRFWHASGIDMQVGADGFRLETESLATVMLGGLSFQSPDDSPGPPAKEDTAFVLAENQAEALKTPDGEAEIILLNFKQSLRGLKPGAEVSFRGLALGQVKSIGIDYDPSSRNSACRYWCKFILSVWAGDLPNTENNQSTRRKSVCSL